MHARTRHRLADWGRFLVLAACLLGAAALALFRWEPAWVDAAGDRLRRAVEDSWLQRWRRVVELSGDQAGERAALTSLGRDLQGVRKLDRLAALVRMVEHRLVAVHRQRGDAGAAVTHARRLLALDDRDLDAVALLGGLLGEDPATRGEAIALLDRAWRRVPDSPHLVPPLVRVSVAAGDVERAGRVLIAAATHPPSNLWHVHWSDHPNHFAWFLPRRAEGGAIEARFSIEDEVQHLRFRLPAFAAVELRNARLRVGSAGSGTTLELADLPLQLVSMRRHRGVLVASGHADPAFTIPAESLAGAVARGGRCTITLTAEMEHTLPHWLRELLLGPETSRIAGAGELDPADARRLASLRSRAAETR